MNGGIPTGTEPDCSCVCTDKYEGTHCETKKPNPKPKPCSNGPNDKQCQNGGKATGTEPDCKCDCDGTGYTDSNCQTLIPPYSCANKTPQGICCRAMSGHQIDACHSNNSDHSRRFTSDGYDCAHLEYSGKEQCETSGLDGVWYSISETELLPSGNNKLQCCRKTNLDGPQRMDCTYFNSTTNRREAKDKKECNVAGGVWQE
ncbi:MAG TPA: hypothetical protein EYO58_08770 [Flavobacteriales bacterium]|nr:hypothetical protein [Flavobacteriales bacterium]